MPSPSPLRSNPDVVRSTELWSQVPDKLTVHKTERLEGTVVAPPSKSYSHRALMIAALCGGQEITVENALQAQDIEQTAKAWSDLGAGVQKIENDYRVRGISTPFEHGQPKKIFVKDSGTTLRFLLPGLSFANGEIKVKGHESLSKRPNQMIVDPLAELLMQVGGAVRGTGERHALPITVDGKGLLPSGNVTISGDKSSQVVSAFLLWLPLATPKGRIARLLQKGASSEIRIEGRLVSKPYVDITLDALRNWGGIEIIENEPGVHYTVPAGQRFKAKSNRFCVNGDYSSAAFLLVAACLCDGHVLVRGLKDDKQGDREIVDILKKMGAAIKVTPDGVEVSGSAPLRGLPEQDCSHIPDLVPILCVLGAFAEGRTRFTNIAHLRYKETDRLVGPMEELRKLGVQIDCDDNSITVEKSELKRGLVNARFDHRMAMSLVVAGLAGNGCELDGATSIRKSYRTFLRDMASLGARVVERD